MFNTYGAFAPMSGETQRQELPYACGDRVTETFIYRNAARLSSYASVAFSKFPGAAGSCPEQENVDLFPNVSGLILRGDWEM